MDGWVEDDQERLKIHKKMMTEVPQGVKEYISNVEKELNFNIQFLNKNLNGSIETIRLMKNDIKIYLDSVKKNEEELYRHEKRIEHLERNEEELGRHEKRIEHLERFAPAAAYKGSVAEEDFLKGFVDNEILSGSDSNSDCNSDSPDSWWRWRHDGPRGGGKKRSKRKSKRLKKKSFKKSKRRSKKSKKSKKKSKSKRR